MTASAFWTIWGANFPSPDRADVGEVWEDWVATQRDDVINLAIDILAESNPKWPKLAQLKQAAAAARKQLNKPPPMGPRCEFCEGIGRVEVVWLTNPAGRDQLLNKQDGRIFQVNTRTTLLPCRCSLGKRIQWRALQRAGEPGGVSTTVSDEQHGRMFEVCGLSIQASRDRDRLRWEQLEEATV